MSINWFTFVAQIVNFLVLVWLLSRLLYKPIINAMAEREKKIAATLEEAAAARREAEQEAARYRQQTHELAQARQQLLATAGQEVEAWRAEQLGRARNEVDEARADWYQALNREKQSLVREARRLVVEQVHRMSQRVLAELADVDLQRRMVDSFLSRLQQIEASQKLDIVALIQSSDHQLVVETAFPLAHDDRDRVAAALHEHLSGELQVQFREDPALICGVELQAAGYKVAWSTREPLAEMEEELMRSLDQAITLEGSPP